MGADKEKGLFSVGVDRTFVHPNGKTGTVKCSRTVLADKLQIVEIQKYYVQFYKDAGNDIVVEVQLHIALLCIISNISVTQR